MTRRTARRGFSLVIVLVLTSALLFIAVAFTDAVVLALRTTRLGWQGERATHAADGSALSALASWDAATAVRLRVGESDTITGSSQPSLRTGVIRTRLQARLFVLEGWAESRDGAVRPSTRHIWRAVRLQWPIIPAHAALTALGSITVGPNVAVLGADAQPAGWNDECAADARTHPVVAMLAGAATVDTLAVVAGQSTPVRLITAPEHSHLDSIIAEAVLAFNARATVVTSDSVLSLDAFNGSSPACPLWFGDARRSAAAQDACSRRWPIVIAAHPGETQLIGHTPAQGTLIVMGDLQLHAGVRFAGLLIVNGRLTVSAPSAAATELVGAVIIRDARNHQSTINGAVVVQSSRCALRLALAAAGQALPVPQHGWTERP